MGCANEWAQRGGNESGGRGGLCLSEEDEERMRNGRGGVLVFWSTQTTPDQTRPDQSTCLPACLPACLPERAAADALQHWLHGVAGVWRRPDRPAALILATLSPRPRILPDDATAQHHHHHHHGLPSAQPLPIASSLLHHHEPYYILTAAQTTEPPSRLRDLHPPRIPSPSPSTPSTPSNPSLPSIGCCSAVQHTSTKEPHPILRHAHPVQPLIDHSSQLKYSSLARLAVLMRPSCARPPPQHVSRPPPPSVMMRETLIL
ncbi:hypothetical protein BKA80DRAFT_77651 [Phyllosticta citrichinensis]